MFNDRIVFGLCLKRNSKQRYLHLYYSQSNLLNINSLQLKVKIALDSKRRHFEALSLSLLGTIQLYRISLNIMKKIFRLAAAAMEL